MRWSLASRGIMLCFSHKTLPRLQVLHMPLVKGPGPCTRRQSRLLLFIFSIDHQVSSFRDAFRFLIFVMLWSGSELHFCPPLTRKDRYEADDHSLRQLRAAHCLLQHLSANCWRQLWSASARHACPPLARKFDTKLTISLFDVAG